jgi:hypothetical protein
MYSFTNKNTSSLNNKNGKRKTKKLPRKLMMLPADYQPEATDVLCGRGNMYGSHPGNQCFQRIIFEHMKAYSDAENRPVKINIVDNVLSEVRNSGARIVKIDSKTKRWYELNDVESHQKCGHCLRDTIRLHGKENNIIRNSNSKKRIKNSSIAIMKQKRQARTVRRQQQQQEDDTCMKDSLLRINIETNDDLVDFVCGGTDGKNLQHRLSLLADYSNDFLLNEENYLILTTTTTADCNGSSSFLLFDNEFPEDDIKFSPSSFFSQTI